MHIDYSPCRRAVKRAETGKERKILFPLLSLLLILSGLAVEPVRAHSGVDLTSEEAAYVSRSEPVRICVDGDWRPFEWIDGQGVHRGIAADLISLVAERTGLRIVVLPTANWEDSLAASRAGRCPLLSFVNQTPDRGAWLVFTEPLFLDPNVIITHERPPDVADPEVLEKKLVALPAGTMVAERMARDYPMLRIVPTVSE